MVVYISGTSVCRCRLTSEDAQKIRQYAEENNITLEEAVDALYNQDEINLYYDCEESEYDYEKVDQVFDY